MTPQEINTTIAEFCGIVSHDKHGTLYHTRAGYVRDCPDYYGDLNECREVLMRFTESQKCQYLIWLNDTNRSESYDFNLAFSAPPQVCKAILRTINKWRDSQ